MGLLEDWENAPYTTVSQMPQTGTATYRGVAMYGEGEVLSSAEMQANFANDSISGRLHNFQAQNGTPISGEVAIRNGVITGAEYSATLAGQLSAAGERASVSGTAYGDFSGRQAEIVDGSISAQVETSYGTEYVSGEMILKR
ncbi:transferrin-binding protein-like solute binding protein [Paracoccus pantotrophus]|uniref:Transferrin-binding protein-like solute binding protein n=1 Tax=Paracoccus pantotrophus TaxID=82367 RepID=A0AAE6NWB5_PARPN|nr:transferrin-binding protein-like solute binding protein [Paracoccus pantotrophus]QFG37684.1 transferrin-binding protein-like solute binding protein [Paracoccus pantotrophus]